MAEYYEIALEWMPLDLTNDEVNIGSSNGLLPGSMSVDSYKCHPMASMGSN